MRYCDNFEQRGSTATLSRKLNWNSGSGTGLSKREQTREEGGFWWSRQGSNLRPSHCERDALPTELRPQPSPAKLARFFSRPRRGMSTSFAGKSGPSPGCRRQTQAVAHQVRNGGRHCQPALVGRADPEIRGRPGRQGGADPKHRPVHPQGAERHLAARLGSLGFRNPAVAPRRVAGQTRGADQEHHLQPLRGRPPPIVRHRREGPHDRHLSL